MSSNNAKNIIELRQLLSAKFPGVRMSAGRHERVATHWATGLSQIDLQLEGGLAKSAITEVVSPGCRSGSSLLLGEMVRQAHRKGEWIALIDGTDSFDPASLENTELSRLLWVRTSTPKEAMKAADLVFHDGTIPIVLIDLAGSDLRQLRRIPTSTWHRVARTIETTETICVIFTPEAMIITADARLALQPRFTLDSIDSDRERLLAQIVATPFSAHAEKGHQIKVFGSAGA